jgi:hypothetical protein
MGGDPPRSRNIYDLVFRDSLLGRRTRGIWLPRAYLALVLLFASLT